MYIPTPSPALETLGDLHVSAPPRPAAPLIASALLGLAAGQRSTVPLAILALERPRRKRWISAAVTALALGELVVDKLAIVPARTRALPALARVASGALAGSVIARGAGFSTAGALLGGVAAVVATRIGAQARRAAGAVLPPFVAGVIEDATALMTAIAGVTLARAGATRA